MCASQRSARARPVAFHDAARRRARTRKTTFGATKVRLQTDDGLATEPSGVQSRAGPQSGGVSAGSASAVRGRTLSAHVGTRKMVNYAWPG